MSVADRSASISHMKGARKRQREAFVGVLNALDKSRVARMLEARGQKTKALELETEFEVQGGAAFRRIAIYGDKAVVTAIAEWSRQDVSPRDLGELALFCRPPSTQ